MTKFEKMKRHRDGRKEKTNNINYAPLHIIEEGIKTHGRYPIFMAHI